MRQDAEIEAMYREGQLGARFFDNDELRFAELMWGRRVMSMIEQLMVEVEQRERLLLLCAKE